MYIVCKCFSMIVLYLVSYIISVGFIWGNWCNVVSSPFKGQYSRLPPIFCET